MSDFVVSARKYRPATFDTVVGQDHITQTLKNAIRTKHLAQAFLFCGPRGVGKTTCARILAKTLNCHNLSSETEPCNQCDSCESFNRGSSLNIYELDAASNNSVDDMRNLTEQVRYAPHQGEYKIYIIDEVHMLSSAAFNAFLKTLEEPPSYAIFILATTEKHKILPTILSRCQIFDFNRIRTEDIAHHLAFVAGKEHVDAEPDALYLIATKSDGALRDALSIFDQMVSYSGSKLSCKDVVNNLSILDYDYFFRFADYFLKGDTYSTLLLYNEVLSEGFEGHHFLAGLAQHFRDLLVCQHASTIELLEVGESVKLRYREQSALFTPEQLFRMMELVSACESEYRNSRNQRLLVELYLLKMCGLLVSVKQSIETVTTSIAAPPPIALPIRPQTAPVNLTPPPAEKKEPVSIKPPAPALEVPVSKPLPAPAAPKASPSVLSGLFSGTSIKDLDVVNEKKPDTAAEPEVLEAQNLLSPEEFDSIWGTYLQTLIEEKKPQLYASLQRSEHRFENNTLYLNFSNQSQLSLFNEDKIHLIEYFISKSQKSPLKTECTIVESKPSEEAYTSQEKYARMVAKNPALEDFRRELGLELD